MQILLMKMWLKETLGVIAEKSQNHSAQSRLQTGLEIRYVSSDKNLLLQKLTVFSQAARITSHSLSCISLRRKWNIG